MQPFGPRDALLSVSVLVILALCSHAVTAALIPQAHSPLSHPQWSMHADAPEPESVSSLTFVLAKRNTDKLEALLMSVSDPKSPTYGQGLTNEAMRAMTQPAAEVIAQWDEWTAALLAAHADSPSASAEWNEAHDIMRVRLPVSRMEQLIGHKLRAYTHVSGVRSIRASVTSDQLLRSPALTAALPAALRASVAYTAGVTRFPPQLEAFSNKKLTPSAFVERVASKGAPGARDSALRSAASTTTTTTSFGDEWGQNQALRFTQVVSDNFFLSFGAIVACSTPTTNKGNWTIPSRSGATGLFSCFGGGTVAQAYSGTTIVLTLASTGANRTVLNFPASSSPLEANSQYAILYLTIPLPTNYDGWNLQVTYNFGTVAPTFMYPFALHGTTRVLPLTVKQLYGVPDSILNGISSSTRSATRMSIAALWLSSAAGQQGFYNLQDLRIFFNANKLDLSLVDLIKYVDGSSGLVRMPLDQSKPDNEVTLDISLTMGTNAGVGLSVLHTSYNTDTPFEDVCNMVLADSTISVLSISYGGVETAQDPQSIRETNALFQMLGIQLVSVFAASGDWGSFESGGSCDGFSAFWPASSPYLTSVGGTALTSPNPGAYPTEVVCSVEVGSLITGGGGFSALFPRPAYQDSFVSGWIAAPGSTCPKPQIFAFNRTNRAYPDISLLAHNFEITYSGDTVAVAGTSASAPALAGIIAAYNAARVQAGGQRLGFLNPLLYQLAVSEPRAFNDITNGTTRCMGSLDGCCQEGFTSCPGFDPTSGLGSPNFRFLGPLLAPSVTPLNVSNQFFPSSPGYVPWVPAPGLAAAATPAAGVTQSSILALLIMAVLIMMRQ